MPVLGGKYLHDISQHLPQNTCLTMKAKAAALVKVQANLLAKEPDLGFLESQLSAGRAAPQVHTNRHQKTTQSATNAIIEEHAPASSPCERQWTPAWPP